VWYGVRQEEIKMTRSGENIFTETSYCLKRQLHQALQIIGTLQEDLQLYSFHSLRKGAGVDILKRTSTRVSTGADQMLQEGDWKSVHSAFHYATAEEFQQAVMEESDAETG
jgi:hypothetical protein